MGDHTKDRRVSEHTRKLLKSKGLKVQQHKPKGKFYRGTANVFKDYNLLENQYVVRKYFQKKYGVPLNELELLLYLYPKQFFSHADYKLYPRNFTYRQIQKMIAIGHVRIYKEGKNYKKHIYTLSQSSKHLVLNYYKLLNGDLQIPTISENNPMIRKDATPHEQRIIKMMRAMSKKNKD